MEISVTAARILELLIKNVQHEPTSGQYQALRRISNFLDKSKTGDTYLLKGYAGTGKTTVISALVKTLPSFGIRTVLLAPTGRAAKVMSTYSGRTAYTIHRRIYRPKMQDGTWVSHNLAPNNYKNTVIIVDEASMIGDRNREDQLLSSQNLLNDLLRFVATGEDCRLILVGDSAQLPPVGQSESPALDIKLLTGSYGLRAGFFELTEVVRQEADSGILVNATILREAIRNNLKLPRFETEFPDFQFINHQELGDLLSSDYSSLGPEEVVVVCRSNKSANRYNRQIRFTGLWMEEEISAGDFIMCVKNNYFWLNDDSSNSGFIANGDVMRITRVESMEEKFGFRFANLTVQLVDYPDQPGFNIKIIIDSLHTESPALTHAQSAKLYSQIKESYPDVTSKTKLNSLIAKDPWYQAVQVKFAYAVTCHKAQGGQWKHVFVDQGYITEEMKDKEYLRWLYTAITRATEKVYLINFEQTEN